MYNSAGQLDQCTQTCDHDALKCSTGGVRPGCRSRPFCSTAQWQVSLRFKAWACWEGQGSSRQLRTPVHLAPPHLFASLHHCINNLASASTGLATVQPTGNRSCSHPKSTTAVSDPFLCFGTVASALRQQSSQARRCMALAVASSQALLSTLVAWESETAACFHQSQPASLTAADCGDSKEASEGLLLTACAAALRMLWSTAADAKDLGR